MTVKKFSTLKASTKGRTFNVNSDNEMCKKVLVLYFDMQVDKLIHQMTLDVGLAGTQYFGSHNIQAAK